MNFDKRKTIAADMLGDFLTRFAPPRGVDDDHLPRVASDIAEAFARKLPLGSEDGYRERIREIFRVVSDAHKGYAWPSQAEFVEAMRTVATPAKAAPQGFEMNPLDLAARRIAAGEPVAERWVWSNACFGRHGVTLSMLEGYRKASVAAHLNVYRDGTRAILEGHYGAIVNDYFPGAKPAAS